MCSQNKPTEEKIKEYLSYDPFYGEEAFKAYHDRVQNGCRLFGLQFQNLWS